MCSNLNVGIRSFNEANCKPIDSTMDSNKKLMRDESELFSELERYRKLVGKLIYLTITRSYLSCLVGVESISAKPSH